MRPHFYGVTVTGMLALSAVLHADSLADTFVVDGVRLAVARTHVETSYDLAAAQIEAGFRPQTKTRLAGALILGRQVGSLHQTLTLRPSVDGAGTDITAASRNLEQATAQRAAPTFNLYPGASILRAIEFNDRSTHVAQWVGRCRCSAEQMVRRFAESAGGHDAASIVTAAPSIGGALVAVRELRGQVTTLVARAMPRGSVWVAVAQTRQHEESR